MDWSVTHALNSFLASHDAIEDPLVAYVNAAELLFAGVLAAVFVLARGPARRGWRRLAAAAGGSAAVALLVGQVVSHLVDRPRPFVTHHGLHLFTPHAADPGFPSDHATAAFAIATAVLLRNRRWGIVAMVFAIVLSVGRVAMGVHYPTDVLGGAALGSACALVLWLPALRRLVHRIADFVGGAADAVTGVALSR